MKVTRLSAGISIRRTIAEGTGQQVAAVKDIIQDVRNNGDQAMFRYAEKWDGAKLSALRVTDEEIARQSSDSTANCWKI